MRFILVLSLLFAVVFAAPVADNEVNPETDEAVGDPAAPKSAPFTEMNPTDTSVSETTTMDATTMSAGDDMATKESKNEMPKAKAPTDDASDVKPDNPEKKVDEEAKPAMPDEPGKENEMNPEMKPDVKPEEKPEAKPEEKPEDGKDEKKDEKPTEDKNDENGFTIYAVIQPPVYRINPFYNTFPNYPGVNIGPYYPTYHRTYPSYGTNYGSSFGSTYGSPSGYGGYRVVVVPQTVGYNGYNRYY